MNKLSSLFTVMSRRVTDLERILIDRGQQQRKINKYCNHFIYIYSYHLSFFVDREQLHPTVKKLFKRSDILLPESAAYEIDRAWTDYSLFIELFNENGDVISNARDGVMRPFKTETIVRLLNISKREQQKLRTLVNRELKHERKKGRDALETIAKQREKGIKPRQYCIEDKHREKVKVAQKASQLLQKGFTKTAVAEALDVSRPTLNSILNETYTSVGEELQNEIFLGDYRAGITNVADETIDLLLTDPPYLLGMADWDYDFDYGEFCSIISPKVKNGGAALIFCSTKTIGNCVNELTKNDFTVRRILAWEKTNPKPIKNSYAYALEHIVYAVKGKANAVFNLPAHIEKHSGVFKYSSIEKGRNHPTQKPVALMCELIELHTRPGDSVLDTFSGSGSVSIASQLLNRNSIAFEINKNYYERSVERLKSNVKV